MEILHLNLINNKHWNLVYCNREHWFEFPNSALWFGDKSALLAQGAVLSSSPYIDCSLLDSTAIFIHVRPSRLDHCIYCWKVTIAVYVNATILGYRLKKDATSSQNMGRFGLGLVRPGRIGLIVGVGRCSRKGESFKP